MREISERDGDRAAIGIFRRAVTLQWCNDHETRALAAPYRPTSIVVGGGKMAGDDKEEHPPLLPAGFHALDQQARQRICVDRFSDSVTRRRILQSLEGVITEINRQSIQGRIWIDGSFLTEKLNPDDADIALVISGATFTASAHHKTSPCP
jgi:hypothetical protein